MASRSGSSKPTVSRQRWCWRSRRPPARRLAADGSTSDVSETYFTGGNHYRVNFSVTAPGSYLLLISTAFRGAMITVDDGGDGAAEADVSAVSGFFSGGTLTAGSLAFGDPGIRSSSATGNLTFAPTGARRAATWRGSPRARGRAASRARWAPA